jgi:hypothetical protein
VSATARTPKDPTCGIAQGVDPLPTEMARISAGAKARPPMVPDSGPDGGGAAAPLLLLPQAARSMDDAAATANGASLRTVNPPGRHDIG